MDIGFSPIYLFFFFRFFIAESQREQKRSSLENNAERLQSQSTYIPKEYHSVCPLVRMGTPHPSPASECMCPSLGTKGEGTNSPAVEEVGGSLFGRLEKNPSTVCLCPNVTTNKDSDVLSLGQSVPWMMCPLNVAYLEI
jgi:hypothetical protein